MPMNINSSPSPFPTEQINDVDHDQHHQALIFSPNHQVVSSSSSSTSCYIFFNPTHNHRGFYDSQYLQQTCHQEDDNYACSGGSSYEIKNKVENGLKLTLSKKEDQGLKLARSVLENDNQVQWKSWKMKMMNPDRKASSVSIATAKNEVQKLQPSSSFETDLSCNSSSHNGNTPIRVCSDCHTTKTPLWRSGPKGPKSLCNACGIRQRKARRRAMATAAAAANGTVVATDQPRTMKIKEQYKEKIGKNGNSSHFKKHCKIAATAATVARSPGSNGKKKKLSFENFLMNLSKKLEFHRVFSQDEKDAAILLMALSSGLVHG